MKNVVLTTAGLAALVGGGYWWSSSDQPTPSKYDSSIGRISQPAIERTDDPETTRSYEDYGDRDCGDFSSQAEAQEFFEESGGPDDDYHNLDRDGDGVVCESL